MWQRLKFWRQFSLKTLLLAMFVAAVFCGAYRLGFNAGRSDRIAADKQNYTSLIQLLSSSFAPTVLDESSASGTNLILSNIEGTVYYGDFATPTTLTVQSAGDEPTAEQPEEKTESP